MAVASSFVPSKALAGLRLGSDVRLFDQLAASPVLQQLTRQILKEGRHEATKRRLLARALRATDSLVPGVMKTVRTAQSALEMSGVRVEVFIGDSPQMNAQCIELDGGFAFLYTAPLLDRLSEGELAFVTGHELGHAAFGHLALPSAAILQLGKGLDPKLALSLMSWNRRAELSCDRVGLLCSKSLQDSATALIKISSGLGGSVLKFSVADFIAQMNELQQITPSAEEAVDWYATHPFSPLRVAALSEFGESELAPPESGGPRRPVAETERRIEALLRTMEPDAAGPGSGSARDVLLWGGLLVASADGKLDERETACLREAVGDGPFDAAVALLKAAPDADAFLRERLAAAAKVCAALPAPDRHALVQRLIVVARADQDLDPKELAALRTAAGAIGLSPGFVDKIVTLFA